MPSPRYAREIPQRYRMEAGRCSGCGFMAFPPRRVCPKCKGRQFVTERLPLEGKLMTWTVIHVAPEDFSVQTPYVVGIVELAPGVRVTAQIADCDPAELKVGGKVRHLFRRLNKEGHAGILLYGYKYGVVREH